MSLLVAPAVALWLLFGAVGSARRSLAFPGGLAAKLGKDESWPVLPPVLGQKLSANRQDALSTHMRKLYQEYMRQGNRLLERNTIRSFKPAIASQQGGPVYTFNLTNIPNSEKILAASFHFSPHRSSRPRSSFCKSNTVGNACTTQPWHPLLPALEIVFWGAPESKETRPERRFKTLQTNFKGWQARDVTSLVRAAQRRDDPVLHVRARSRALQVRNADVSFLQGDFEEPPYLLVYANDSEILEPNSVVTTLQRYGRFPVFSEGSSAGNASQGEHARVRRHASWLDNKLPEGDTFKEWAEKDMTARQEKTIDKGKRRGTRRKSRGKKARRAKSRMLKFDSETLRQARLEQQNEPRTCARRPLRVDFADIGWNEWIISPDAFDAYYCAGVCQFPMSKEVRPSNHATLQSIVRAIGIMRHVPEPCCVPEVMSAISLLFLDENHNVVLKLYPNIVVESCACR
uniref:Growth differentiation factor 10 n=1 Tax=Eptatretus burgeri TaxID=7764 RepID=A0A8C4QGJ6_EPTBU